MRLASRGDRQDGGQRYAGRVPAVDPAMTRKVVILATSSVIKRVSIVYCLDIGLSAVNAGICFLQ
jgi:hypothetical protein